MTRERGCSLLKQSMGREVSIITASSEGKVFVGVVESIDFIDDEVVILEKGEKRWHLTLSDVRTIGI